MKTDAQWFCVLAVEQGVLTPDRCAELLRQTGTDTDVLTLGQTVIDQGFSDDMETLQGLVDDARARAEGEQRSADVSSGQAPEPPSAPASDPTNVATLRRVSRNLEVEIRTGDLVTSDLNHIADLPEAAAADCMRALLAAGRAYGGSDVHLSAGAVPFMRVAGRIGFLGECALSAEPAAKLNMALLSEERRQEFRTQRDLSFALELPDHNRYRANLALHKEGAAGTYHVVPDRIPTFAELGFEDDDTIARLLDSRNGLIVVAGPVGCGKTTTLAALVDVVNRNRQQHIITIEDPIEFVHTSHSSLVTQREVGRHTESHASALRSALREDPDVIVIGELHDLETTEMAVTAAETGHLVLTTLHTRDAATTLNRLLDVFPPAQQPQIRAMASGSLRGIICQRLLPRADTDAQVLAYELLLCTNAVAKIIREGTTHHLSTVMQTSSALGMRSMDQSVMGLLGKELITREVALDNLTSKDAARRLQGNRPEGAVTDGANSDAAAKKRR